MNEKFYYGFLGDKVEMVWYCRGNSGSIATFVFRMLEQGWGIVEVSPEEFDQFDEDESKSLDTNEDPVNLTVVYKKKVNVT